MGNGISHPILFLVVTLSFFITLQEVKGGCSGGCSISGGGGISSTSFMGDRAVDIGMSSFDEFVRDNLGSSPAASLQSKSPSQDAQLSTNSSINQTISSNSSQNDSVVMFFSNSMAETNSDNRTVKLGAIGMQDGRLSNQVFAAFDKKKQLRARTHRAIPALFGTMTLSFQCAQQLCARLKFFHRKNQLCEYLHILGGELLIAKRG